MSDISVSFAESATQGGRMMPPDLRRKKFRAIEEHTGHTDSCLLTSPPDLFQCVALLWPRRLLPAAPPANHGWWPGSAKHVLPRFDGPSRNVPLKARAGPDFPDDELAYGTRSNVRIFAGAGAALAAWELCDIGVT